MEKTHLQIKDPEVVKAIADPKRIAILRFLAKKKLSARQLGKLLGEPTRNLYYHLNELESYGLIEVTEVKQKGNLLEKYYESKYTYFSLDPELLTFGDECNSIFYSTIASGFQTTLGALQTALAKPGFFDRSNVGAILTTQMTESRYKEFVDKMSDLINEYFHNKDEEGGFEVNIASLCFSTPQTDLQIDEEE